MPIARLGLIGGSSVLAAGLVSDCLRRECAARSGGKSGLELFTWHPPAEELTRLLKAEAWEAVAELARPALRGWEAAGISRVLLGASEWEPMAPLLAAATTVPVQSAAAVVAGAAHARNIRALAIVGTRHRQEEERWRDQLGVAGVAAVFPRPADRSRVAQIAEGELARGHCREPSRVMLMRLVAALAGQQAQAVAWAMPELEMLVEAADSPIPLWSTARLLAAAAFEPMAEPTGIAPA